MATRSLTSLIAAIAIASAAPVAAQTRGAGAAGCPSGQFEGDLGFTGIECVRCVLQPRRPAGAPWIEFQTEPILTGVTRGGPADGKLEERDVLVAIDGDLITTYAAAMRYSHLEPGKPVRLTVRRAGVLKEVEIVPNSKCALPLRSPLVFTTPKTAPALFAKRTAKNLTVSSGWLGVGVRCVLCEIAPQNDISTFRSYLEIIDVQPNTPAMQAGLKAGDLLIAIDGLSLKSIEGTQRFRSVKPGERVTLSFVRDGEVKTVTLTVAARPGDGERIPLGFDNR
jgi:S1-C subfamily serine protease